MVQGGDPEGTGRGGVSIWGKPFEDEIRVDRLKHEGRGILSMANSGPNTNGSQFFITYKSCKHLDKHHTVFGKVVGGLEVLREMELVPTDLRDRPLQDIILTKVVIFMNPFTPAELAKEAAEEEQLRKIDESGKEYGKWYTAPQATEVTDNSKASSIGKYMAETTTSTTQKRKIDFGAVKSDSKKQKTVGQFNNFSSW